MKLLIFDGNSVINRAFYAVRPLTNRAGLHTNALFGFVNTLKKHLDAQKPDYCAVAFDLRAPTFRHKRYDGYKATRKPMPQELAEQMPYAREIVRALGLSVLEREGFEADDILGAVTKDAEDEGVESVIVTGDRDSFQLIDKHTRVLLCTTGADVVYDEQKIMESYGVTPRKLIDIKAIAGDSSDNIPGVRGIGEKGAQALILQAGSLSRLYETPDAFTMSASQREKLLAGRESAFLSFELAEICRDIPGLAPLSALRRGAPDTERLQALFSELEFSRLSSVFGLDSTAPAVPKEEDSGQISLDSLDDAAAAAPVFAEREAALFPNEPQVCLWRDDTLYVLSGGEVFRVPQGERGSFAESRQAVVFDAKAYYHACANAGANPESCRVRFDTQLASYLLDPTGAAQTLSRAAMVFLSRLSAENAPIPTQLALIAQLWEKLPALLIEAGQEELYYGTELPCAKVLCKMERAGFLLDTKGLCAYGEELKGKIQALEASIYDAAGMDLNLNSPRQLGELLFEKLGLPHARKTKTGYSTDAQTLESLCHLSPVVRDILEYRKLSKLYGTYVEGLSRSADDAFRVHTTFLQTQTITGRLSSVDPNLQNIPVRTEEGRALRRFFVAPEGAVLLDADYSQVELRILAHLSGDRALIDTFTRGVDIHSRTASEVFHVPLDAVTPAMRKDAKAINFGIVYGIGDYSLSQDLGVSRARAADYIAHYFESYPGVQSYLQGTVEQAKRDGFVKTLFGRKRLVPELQSDKKQLRAFGERVAMNTPVQGTAADIIKRAMVRIDRRLSEEKLSARLILQVHDEVILECPEEEAPRAKALLKEEMEKAADLSVTLLAEVGEGKNWLEAK